MSGVKGVRVMVDLNGDVRSAAEWSEATNIPVHAIVYRVSQLKWPAEKALTTPYHPGRGGRNREIRQYEYHGEKKTLVEWAEELQQPYNRLQGRVSRGWTFEEAVDTPIGETPERLIQLRKQKPVTKKGADPCEGCWYRTPLAESQQDGPKCCSYILDTKKRRPCPPGAGCTVKLVKKREKKKPMSISIRAWKGVTYYELIMEEERRIASW